MTIAHHPDELLALNAPIAFVPTMGALHEGHLELVRQARRRGRTVVVSVFVNPTQFGPNEDFARYPRDLDQDAARAATAGADVVYAPAVETMYPRGEMTKVVVPEVAELYDGAFRPGHFEGVATVVLKLFNQVRPESAFFGRKDLQQCAVVRRMVEDLDLAIDLEFVPTLRESDGLAMSSRNVYLSHQDREIAPQLYRALVRVARQIADGEPVERSLREGADLLSAFSVDYLDLVSTRTFRPLREPGEDAAVIVAARLGKTRLIDNVELARS